MSIFRKHQVQTLSEWLEIATRKLTNASKERIRVEIEAHYAEAVEAHREDGLSEADAQTAALRELGDANAAGRRFRKQHLTESDETTLKQSEKSGRSIFFLVVSYLWFWSITVNQLSPRHASLHYHYRFLGLLVLFVVVIARQTTCFAIARFGGIKPKRHLLLLQPISGVFIPMLLDNIFAAGFRSYENWFDAFACLTIICYFLQGIRLWIKLGKIGPVRSQSPPSDAAHV